MRKCSFHGVFGRCDGGGNVRIAPHQFTCQWTERAGKHSIKGLAVASSNIWISSAREIFMRFWSMARAEDTPEHPPTQVLHRLSNRTCFRTPITLAKRICGTVDRFDPMSWYLANGTSVTCCYHTCSITMRRARTCPWKGLAGFTCCRGGWSRSLPPASGWTASPICPDLICDRHTGADY